MGESDASSLFFYFFMLQADRNSGINRKHTLIYPSLMLLVALNYRIVVIFQVTEQLVIVVLV